MNDIHDTFDTDTISDKSLANVEIKISIIVINYANMKFLLLTC